MTWIICAALPAGDSNVGLLPLVLAQGSDASDASGSVLAGKHTGSGEVVCQLRFPI